MAETTVGTLADLGVYPEGVTLAELHVGPVSSFLGRSSKVIARVTTVLKGTRYIVHAATGWHLMPSTGNITAEPGQDIVFHLPHTDQTGWRDSSGGDYSGWAYQVTIESRASGKVETYTKTFQLVAGQTGPIELSTIPDGQVGEPVSAPIATVTSIIGKVGDVTEADLAAAGFTKGVDDTATAAIVQDTTTATRTALDGIFVDSTQLSDGLGNATAYTDAEVAAEANARRKNIRDANPSPMPQSAKMALPTTGGLNGVGFGWQDAPIQVFEMRGQYRTDFDPAGVYPLPTGTTYYVDTVNGLSTNDGLTPATAKSNLQFAYQAAASGDTILILDEGTIYRSGGWQGTKITKSIRIKAAHPGLVVAYADPLEYTLTAGMVHTYQSARTNVSKVVDMGLSWAPDGYAYPKLASIADVEARPGSWYHDGTNVYVHMLDGTKPDSRRLLAPLLGQHFLIESSGTADAHVYLDGIRILGGSQGLSVDAQTYRAYYYANNCAYIHSASVAEVSANGANFAGATRVYQRNCRTLGSRKDGFNYTAYNFAGTLKDAPRAIEVDCQAYEHGLEGTYADTCNASTAHAGAKVIRVNCTGHHTRGAVFADVQTGTQSVNYGCVGYDSLSATTGSNSIFHAQQAGADMWIYGGEAFGADWSIYANSGTWMGIRGLIYDTKQGGGTVVTI